MFRHHIHLDLKGMNPDEPGLLTWIDRLADLGYAGLVLEYEDRISWKTWPGTFRAGYDDAAWQRIWDRCKTRGLEVIPLIQTLGHLGWLLRHPAYTHLREAGEVSEACPSHPQLQPLMFAWIDEVIAMHPDSQIIHLGADETFCLATCPSCKARAQRAGGKLNVYLEHVGALARHVLHRGRRPMIWADAFWNGDTNRAHDLPAETILVDWQYGFLGPTELTVRNVPQEVWAASAARSADSYDLRFMQGPLEQRLRNLSIWHRQADAGKLSGLIHTTWARSTSHGMLYGPLEGWWPLIEAAADPARFTAHPLAPLFSEVDAAMHPRPGEQHEPDFMPDLRAFDDHGDVMVRRAAIWWRIAIEHAALVRRAEAAVAYDGLLAPSVQRFGVDSHLQRRAANARKQTIDAILRLRQETQVLLNAWKVSDVEEYLESRFDRMIRALTPAKV